MQEFDIVLKLLLQRSKSLIAQLTGKIITEWLPTELPEYKNQRVDLLGVSQSGTIIQLECQSTNDATMPLRMANYSLSIYEQHDQFPWQIVLYVGRQPLRMPDRLFGPFRSFRYDLIDLRKLDSKPLLASVERSDNVLAILARLADKEQAVREIVQKIADEPEQTVRRFYLGALYLLAGLRGLEEKVEEVATQVPISDEVFLENKVLQRYLRSEFEKGIEKGSRGRLRRLIEQRFGPLSDSVIERLETMSEPELDNLSSRLFDAATIEQLLLP